MLKIDGYSLTKGVTNVSYIKSRSFRVGGHSRHIDDCFTVRCYVTVIKEFRTEDAGAAAPPAAAAAAPLSDLHQNLGELLAFGEGADVAFMVGGETFAAHRCVLASRSPVVREKLFGPAKESTTASVIRIDDMEAHVFKVLVCFVYTDLPEMEGGEEEDVTHRRLVAAADRYGMERLRLVCEDKLATCTTGMGLRRRAWSSSAPLKI